MSASSPAWAQHSLRLPSSSLRVSGSGSMSPASPFCRILAPTVRQHTTLRKSWASCIPCRQYTVSRMEKQTGSFDAGPSQTRIVISNPGELERKKNAIRTAGLSTLQVIADFDMTLTKYMVDGRRGQSSHALLHQGNAEYDLQRQQLFDHYYPLEICPTLALQEKTKLMEEWWEKTHNLLVEGGLTHTAITNSVKNAFIDFRDGVTKFFEILEKHEVPLLVFSAGLADIIEEVMRQKLHRTYKNIRVVSNRMDFDQDGNLLGFRGKTIHVLNKNEHALEMAGPLHDESGHAVGPEGNGIALRQRKNVLLLGDHLGDLGMSDGLNYDNRITIGFLNENTEEWLKTYTAAFDIVVLNDGPMDNVVNLVAELVS